MLLALLKYCIRFLSQPSVIYTWLQEKSNAILSVSYILAVQVKWQYRKYLLHVTVYVSSEVVLVWIET